MADAQSEQRLQMTAIIEQLQALNKSMAAIAKRLDDYVTMVGKQPVKTNM